MVDNRFEGSYTDDKLLKELYQKISILKGKLSLIETQIKERKRKIAKEKGQVVDSIDDLVCDKHPDASFKAVKTIPSSSGNDFNIYWCEQCGKEDISFKSKAYDCPNCGIVFGDYIRRPYCSSKESWESLAGREGQHYHCRVCGIQLGENYWKVS